MGRLNRRTFVAGAVLALALAACGDDPSTVTPQASGSGTGANALFEQLPQRVKDSKKVVVGSDVAYAPIEFFDADGKTVIGLDPDIAKALGDKLGVTFEFQNTAFEGIIPALLAKRIDVIMSAMTDNKERQKQIDFVDYFTAGTAIIVKKGNPEGIKSLDDLCGKTVALQKGTVQADIAKAQVTKCGANKLTVNEFPKDTDALLQVKSGRAVADLNDLPVAAYTAQTSGGGNDFEVVAGQQYEAGPYGIGVRKDDTQLRDAIQAALKAIIADGTYQRILEKWGVTTGALTTATVNGG